MIYSQVLKQKRLKPSNCKGLSRFLCIAYLPLFECGWNFFACRQSYSPEGSSCGGFLNEGMLTHPLLHKINTGEAVVFPAVFYIYR